MFKQITTLCILLFVLAACAPSPPAETHTPSPPPTSTPQPSPTPIIYEASIQVVNEAGEPIPGTKIFQDQSVELADDNGTWRYTSELGELTLKVWGQGYLPQEQAFELEPGHNEIQVELSIDPFGLQLEDLAREGYELVFVEDFQDGVADCVIQGNGNLFMEEDGNYLLYSDLRNLDEFFECKFGPAGLQDAIVQFEFRYPEIRYYEYSGDQYNWQGYSSEFRDGFGISGYPLRVSWGATLQIFDYTDQQAGLQFPITIQQGIQENRWYTLSTKYEGSRVEVRMDDSLRFTYLNPPSMISSNGAQLGAFGQAEIQFDNISMWAPVGE